ncbi:MAG: hypothetical protein ABJ004_17415 [Cyclobacteriaceae bacterium]
MKKCFTTVSVMLVLLSIESCKCNEDFDLDRDFLIGLHLYGKQSNENLLGITAKYKRDSVEIYNDFDQIVYPGPVPLDGSIYFHPYRSVNSKISLNSDITTFFYLHLKDIQVDIDTIKMEYYARIGECHDKEFTYLNFYYNGELVYNSNNPSHGFDIDLYKK